MKFKHLFYLIMILFSCEPLFAQVIEHFSDDTPGASSFNNSGYTFNLTGGRFVIAQVGGYGWTGSAPDDFYIDNYGNYPGVAGVLGSITTSSSTFKVTDLYVFPGETGDLVKNTGTVIIRGKLGGVSQFTFTVLSDSINLFSYINSGWTYVDLSAYNSYSLDQLEFEVTGSLRYLAIDAFKHISASNTAPTVTTQAVSSIGATTATGNGNITALGSPNPTAYGVCWNITGTPTTSDGKVDNGTASATGAFTASMTPLSANTTYYVRAYATNITGTSYGTEVSFTTNGVVPTVTTNAVSGTGTTGTTLNGTVNANNASTTVTFEYGLTTGYGTTVTADQSPATGTGNTSVSNTISGLAMFTTYHYRIVAVNSTGTSYGGDLTFKTLTVPPSGSTNAASGITSTSATLNGTINAKNASTTVSFNYGLTTGYGTTVTADESPVTGTTNTSVSKTLTGLVPNTTYHYRVTAFNEAGTITALDQSFTTSGVVPTATTDAASGTGTTGTTLNGTVNANNASTTVTFEYGLTTGYGTSVTADQSPLTGTVNTSVSKAITGLTPNTTYHYRVVGVNSSGTSNGADQTFTTSQAPPTATTDAASGVSGTGATLNGTVNANNTSTTVTFEYGLTTGYGTSVTADQSPATGTGNTSVSKAITGLTPNTLYHYRVKGVNGAGTTNGSDQTFTASGVVPTATTDAASGTGTTGTTLNGTVNANNASTTVTFEYGLTTGYGTSVTADQSPVTGTVNTSVSKAITGLTPNTTYHYRVVGVNASGTTNGLDQTFTTSQVSPTATTDAASGVSGTGATLNGTVNANNTSTTVTFEYGLTTGYGTSVTADQSPATGTGNTSVSKSITGLTPNTLYHYRVKGVNGAGTTNGSDQTFTTSGVAPTVTTNAASGTGTTGTTLNGTVNANNASTTVTFEYGLTTGYGTSVTADQSPATGTGDTSVSKAITGLTPNTLYHYRVVGVNGAGTTNGSDQTFTTGGIVPTVTTNAASGTGTTGTTLNGTVNANNASTSVTFEYGLTVAYGTTVTAAESPVTGTTNTSVSKTLSGLSSNTTYHYRVVGVNATGTSNGGDQTFTTSRELPTVSTNAASAVNSNQATLNGTVNANNSPNIVEFEYGLTTAYGSTVTADQSPVTGTSNTSVSKTISGLTPNTTYHYRTKSYWEITLKQGKTDNQSKEVNLVGAIFGADQTFSTISYATISGNVTHNGSGLEGVKVSCTGKADVVTGANGTYSFEVAQGGNYTITPTREYFIFTPGSATITNITSNQVKDFTANGVSGISYGPVNINFGSASYLSDNRDTIIVISNTSAFEVLQINSVYLSSTSSPFWIVGNIPSSIPKSGRDSIKIRFKTDSVGTFTDQLIIKNNSQNSPQSVVSVQGTITPINLEPLSQPIVYSATTINKAKDTLIFKIKNNSSSFRRSTLSVISIMSKTLVGDTGSFHFLKNDQNVSLGPGQTDTTIIEFYPKTLGTKIATLVLTTNDQNGQRINISLNGNSGGNPKIASSSNNINFGELKYNSSKDINVVIRNDGSLPLIINGVNITGNDKGCFQFLGNVDGKNIENNQSDTLKVRFTSQFPVGNKTAQLQIFTNDISQNPYVINLNGFLRSQLLTKPFFRLYFDSTSVGQNIISLIPLMNSGNDTLKINELFIDGPYLEEFSLSTSSGSVLPDGELEIKATFKPLGPGMRYARIGIRSNDPLNSESAIILIGWGKSQYYLSKSELIAFGINNQNTTTITWKKIADASSYSIDICPDTNFSGSNIQRYAKITNNQKIITGLEANRKYYFRVRPENEKIVGEWSEISEFISSGKVLVEEAKKNVPEGFRLNQNYPNPFNPSTMISYQLPYNNYVILKVYDVMGKEIANLVSENQQAGYHEVQWNAISVPSGIYYYKLIAGEFVDMKKLILLK